jgi:hypothetical protein
MEGNDKVEELLADVLKNTEKAMEALAKDKPPADAPK